MNVLNQTVPFEQQDAEEYKGYLVERESNKVELSEVLQHQRCDNHDMLSNIIMAIIGQCMKFKILYDGHEKPKPLI
jgi:hypothetical protein